MQILMKIPFLILLLLLQSACSAKVVEYKLEVTGEYMHDVSAYTQGLFLHEGRLYESTGQYGSSSIRIVALESGEVLRKLDFAGKYFGEGSAVLDGKLYVLTWTNGVAFVYDARSLEYLQAYSYPRNGWGLTSNGKSLIASDGSDRLYFLTPEFELERSLKVSLNGRAVRNLNELEWIEGRIWANVYMTDMIVIINPDNGKVEATVDCSGLLPRNLRTARTDVLNGIAYDSEEKRIFLTGKYWPRLYEVKLLKKKK